MLRPLRRDRVCSLPHDTCRILISDVTHERPNVYYELGYAHALEKEVIILARDGTPLHFDIKDYNVIFYSNLTQLEARLAIRLQAAQANRPEKAG